ncbi:hypothetical protein DFH08DRAFT_963637 [Mycena albidolilacea]|uniref:Uncharacterized protein n=1 Tax=Mycena albidolilacea TaxID=1033008 RepID=A0AAD6ZV13_9AGAR|nr:hypothetical protein DFH08DRAFT_963637 [Mycena albidolilacea]
MGCDVCGPTQYFPPPPLYHIGTSTAFADGTSNLGNELKPKPQVCLAASLFPNLRDTNLRDTTLPPARLPCPSSHHAEHQRSPPTTPTTPKRPHLIAALPPSAPTTPQIQRTAQEFFLSPPLFVRALSDPTNTPTVTTVAPTGDSIELLACGNTSTPRSRRSKGAGRPAWVGGELAGLTAAGVNARGAERQEQLCVIVFLGEAGVYGVDAATV